MFKWWGWNVPCLGCKQLCNDDDLKLWECDNFKKVIAYIDYEEDTERLTPFGQLKYHTVCERRE